MFVNQGTAILTSKITLVPYEKRHVETYHEWMKDPEIQEATASEPLSLEEEYAMQASWRTDADKLTFIACKPPSADLVNQAKAGTLDAPSEMIGDVNLFLSTADEDPEGCIGELELMVAPQAARRQGYGRATILAFLHYIQRNLAEVLAEFGKKEGVEKMKLLQLKAKIGSKNEKSIKLFESIGFIKVNQSANYFGELELVLEGFIGEKRTSGFLTEYGVEGYREVYVDER